MNDRPPPQPDQHLPVPLQQTTAIGRPGGRSLPPQSWETGEPDKIPWGQYIDALRRRWWVVVLVAVAGSYVGWQLSLRVPAEYHSQVKIFGVTSASRSNPTGAYTAPSVLTPSTLQDMVKIPDVVTAVVDSLKLNVHFKPSDSTFFRGFAYDSVFSSGEYRFAVDTTGRGYVLTRNPRSDSPQHETGNLGDPVGRDFGFIWTPPASNLKPKQVVEFAVNDVVVEGQALAGRLNPAFEESGGQILTVTLESSNRGMIAATLNMWAQVFIEYVSEAQREWITKARSTIEDQLTQAAIQRDAAERALRAFNEANVFMPAEPTAAATLLATQVTQLQQVKSDRQRIAAVLASVSRGRIEEARLHGSPTIVNASPRLPVALQELAIREQELQRTLQDYADGSLNVANARSRFRYVNDTLIPEILRGIDANFEQLENELTAQVGTRRTEIGAIPERMLQGIRAQTNFDEALKFWTAVNARAQDIRLLDETTTSGLTILGDAVTPAFPTSSRGPRLFLMAIVASIGAGLGLALLLDKLDRRFRYPQQAIIELGLTIAGTIPFFRPNRKGELNLTASAQVVESFRTLRLATQFHFAPTEPVVVCISSPGPGEGKSLVASNLAVAFANAGQKTLLIDGDVRRGVVHTTFESDRRPGLVDYLGGTATSAQIVRPTSTDHLHIIPSGSRSRRAPELLTSDRMAGLVAEMRELYAVIIIDSAPFVAGMDAFALGAAAGSMLVVLRPGVTDRKLAENKLEILDRLPVTIIGAVLNAIAGGRAYRYYSDYATYEGTEDDVDEADFDAGPPPTSPTRLIGRR